jgi:hypothetical protein
MNYLVDECFREEVEKYRWSRHTSGHARRGYWVPGVGVRFERMHILVWRLAGRQAPIAPLTIDHINQDPTDNRLENLRLATKRLQGLNRNYPNKSGLPRGVKQDSRRKSRPYEARMAIGGIQKSLGGYPTPEEASAAYEAELARQIAIEETRVQELIHA